MYQDSTVSKLAFAVAKRDGLKDEYEAACLDVSTLLLEAAECDGASRAELAQLLSVSGPRVTQLVQRAKDQREAEWREHDAEARLDRTLHRVAVERGDRHSGWRKGTPQCDGCRRILSGYQQQCPSCGGYSRPRDGARGGRTV